MNITAEEIKGLIEQLWNNYMNRGQSLIDKIMRECGNSGFYDHRNIDNNKLGVIEAKLRVLDELKNLIEQAEQN